MKESILLIVLIFVTFVFFFLNKNEVIYMKSEYDNQEYLVRNGDNKREAANLLSQLTDRLFKLKDFLEYNISKYPKYKNHIQRLCKNLDKNRTKIYETEINSDQTSYSVNKGEELVFCLRSKQTKEMHPINLLMYVGIHEISHVACPEIGHTPLFKDIFSFFTQIAIQINIYNYHDYATDPVEYCGMILNSSII
ncbi:hypothetical protein CPAV1605_420 [seawater metagenome]|uniref:WLM domain-containing protein n=1 Tax=seawater metagenome TaxID=1561972 RepID=A0A5E8CL90_9ZZZZ